MVSGSVKFANFEPDSISRFVEENGVDALEEMLSFASNLASRGYNVIVELDKDGDGVVYVTEVARAKSDDAILTEFFSVVRDFFSVMLNRDVSIFEIELAEKALEGEDYCEYRQYVFYHSNCDRRVFVKIFNNGTVEVFTEF
ncbi:hypothetical protein [Thermococcus sp. 21S9]|uniref:hypothetical protein n=1 Tax=Thermococcus sp. 21S9 TaxID=1638223 RepID=UPI00143AEC86|nr:hypothetical protein [Thermococcus sp. 21S9]NJE54665.1 hypothetical protein [Thermococcus sp. 21S9]